MSGLRADLALIAEWVQTGSRVLDLGCGEGELLAHLQDARGVSGYGLEIDPAKLVRCVERGVSVVQTDLNEGLTQFADQSFDYVVLTQTLQAVRRPDRLLQEMLRVGKEGVVTFLNYGYWKCRWRLLTGFAPMSTARAEEWYTTENIHSCTVADFDRLCKKLGIVILECAVLDDSHQATCTARWLPNLFAEIGVYRIGLKG